MGFRAALEDRQFLEAILRCVALVVVAEPAAAEQERVEAGFPVGVAARLEPGQAAAAAVD
jgi:hypothetical protein